MDKQRPVFLQLTKLRLPVMAIVSILHRLSGFVLFLMIPFLLWIFQSSMTPNGFQSLAHALHNPMIKIGVWIILAALLYHVVAGVRHLLMDIHFGDELKCGRIAAWATFVISFLLIIGAGVWLW